MGFSSESPATVALLSNNCSLFDMAPRGALRYIRRLTMQLLVLISATTLAIGGSSLQAQAPPAAGNGRTDSVNVLVGQLNDKDSWVRDLAASTLARIGAPAVEPLIAALNDRDSHLRCTPAGLLGEIKDPRAVEPLIAALKDNDFAVPNCAAWALGEIRDPRAVEPLIALLENRDLGGPAASALADLTGGPFALEELMARSGAAAALGAIASALGEIGDTRAVEPLIAALKYPDVRGHAAVASALGKIKDPRAVEPLVLALKDSANRKGESFSGRDEEAWALGEIQDPRAVEPLIAALKDAGVEGRGAAASALVKIGAPAVGLLIVTLGDGDSVGRTLSAHALGEIQDPRAIEPLIAASKDADIRIRAAAVLGLCKIKDPRAVESLIAALKDTGLEVRRAAASALGEIRDPRAVEPLIEALKGPDSADLPPGAGTREEAAVALGEIKDPRAVEPLIAALTDRSVRSDAASALGKIGDSRAIEPLIAALADRTFRSHAISALVVIGGPAVEPLTAALQNSYGDLENGAAFALAGIGTPAAVRSLLAALKVPSVRAQENAALALCGIEDTGAPGTIRAALVPVVAKVYRFLIGYGAPSSEDALIEALRRFGNRKMALEFINCGNPRLEQAGRGWAAGHGYRITSTSTSPGAVGWGKSW